MGLRWRRTAGLGGSGELRDWDGGVGVGSPLEISIAGMMNRINFK